MRTNIEWTQIPGTIGETWNPVIGCSKVSEGCRNCYAKTLRFFIVFANRRFLNFATPRAATRPSGRKICA